MRDELRSELLSAYHDGELPSMERSEVERLLAEDESAQRELDELQELSATLSTFGTEEAPNGLHEAVMRQIERESLLMPSETMQPAARGRSVWVSVVAGVATVAACLVITVKSGLLDGEPEAVVEFEPQPNELGVELDLASNEGGEQQFAEASPEMDDGLDNGIAKEEESAGEMAEALVADATPAPAPTGDPRGGTADPQDGFGRDLRQKLVVGRRANHEFRSSLEFGDDLQQADVGDVVKALESRDGEVAVVRLTVVDRREGLEALQLLLARNAVVRDKAAPTSDELSDRERSSSTLEAVYVEATQEQLAKTLEQLRSYETFKSLDIGEPIVMARLDGEAGGFLPEDRAYALADADSYRKRGEKAVARTERPEPNAPLEAAADKPDEVAPGKAAPGVAALSKFPSVAPADEPKPVDADAEAGAKFRAEKKDSSVTAAAKSGEANGQTSGRRFAGRTADSAEEDASRLARDAVTRLRLFENKSLDRTSRQRNLRVPPALFVEQDRKKRRAGVLAEGEEAEGAEFGGAAGGGLGSTGVRTEASKAKNRRPLPVVFVLVLDKSPEPAKPAAQPAGPEGA